MIADFSLTLRFKGARTYVQGPDIHDEMCDALIERGIVLEKVDLVCHRLIATNVTAREIPAEESPAEGVHAVFRFNGRTIVLTENGEPITLREPYDEPALVAKMELDATARRIAVDRSTGVPPVGPSGVSPDATGATPVGPTAETAVLRTFGSRDGCGTFSNAELVVALNKELLTRCFPEAKGKWLFTRLQLPQSFRKSQYARIEVQFLGHSNFRITRSALFGDGQPLGHLFFSLLPAV